MKRWDIDYVGIQKATPRKMKMYRALTVAHLRAIYKTNPEAVQELMDIIKEAVDMDGRTATEYLEEEIEKAKREETATKVGD